jgi:hypothetical protein
MPKERNVRLFGGLNFIPVRASTCRALEVLEHDDGNLAACRRPKYRRVMESIAGAGPEKLGMSGGGAYRNDRAGKNGLDPQCVLRVQVEACLLFQKCAAM